MCLDPFERMHKGMEKKDGAVRPPSTLRPPPLFRSLGPPGLPANLPPHRRLRSIFCRSRAVLPATAYHLRASDAHTFTDIRTGNPARAGLCPLGCDDVLSEDTHRGGRESNASVLRSGGLRDTGPMMSGTGKQDRELLSHLHPPARDSGGYKGRQGRLVTPLQTLEEPVIKERKQQKRRKRSYKVDCAGRQNDAVPALAEKEEDARLCEWLQSLGMAESNEKATIGNLEPLFAPRRQEVAATRRDRRPHFLPPIRQTDPLLQVPVLLPENTPPPTPCSHLDAPYHCFPVPPLKPMSLRRK